MRNKVYRLVGYYHTNYGWLLANKAIARRFWVQHLYSLRNLTFEQLLQNNFLSGIITIICNLKMSPNICHEINEWTLITVTEILQWTASPLFKCSLQTLRFKLRPLPMSSQCVTEKKGKSGRWKLRDVNRLYPLRYLALKIWYITADLHSSIQSLTLGVKLTTEQVLRKKMLNH